jgi:deoxycytidylate deaminase
MRLNRAIFTPDKGWVRVEEATPDWSRVRLLNLLTMAHELSTMSTCHKGGVGAIVTDLDLNLQSVGHNRRPEGLEHLTCAQLGCDTTKKCKVTIHAEMLALSGLYPSSDPHGHVVVLSKGSCLNCLKHCLSRNVRAIIFAKPYNIPEEDAWAYSAILKHTWIKMYQLEGA